MKNIKGSFVILGAVILIVIVILLLKTTVSSKPTYSDRITQLSSSESKATMKVVNIGDSLNQKYSTIWFTPSQMIFSLKKDSLNYDKYLTFLKKSQTDGSYVTFTFAPGENNIILSVQPEK